MSLIESFISNKIYGVLYLDFLLKFIWERVIELWNIGGSAIPGAIILLVLMLIIILIPFIAPGYLIYRMLKHYEII